MDIDFKLLFESAPGLSVVLSPDLTIVAATDAYLKTTHTTRESIIGKYAFDVFPSNPNNISTYDTDNIMASLKWVLKNKASHSLAVQKYDIVTQDGVFHEKYWSLRNSPILNAQNEVIYILNTVTDVTEFMLFELQQKAKDLLTEDLLANAADMRREIFERAQDIQKLNATLEKRVFERTEQIEEINRDLEDYKYALDESCIVSLTDAKGKILYVNDSFCRLTKYTREELIGQDHIIFNSGFHSKELMRQLWAVIESGNTWKGELKNIAKDGTVFWVDTTIVPFLNDTGTPYKYLAIRYDITERMLAHAAVLASEIKYRNFFENSLVALFTTDFQTLQPIDVNEFGAKLLGYSTRKDFLDNFNTNAPYHYSGTNTRENNKKTLEETGVINDKIQKITKLDGTVIWVNMFARLNKEDNIVQTVMLDVTEQVQAREELEGKVRERTLELTKNFEREKELNTIKSRFVTTASHEFRTPLTSILSSASLIAMYKDGANEEVKLKHVNRIMSSVKTLIDILNDFLSLEQLEKGVIEMEKSTFSLPDLINSITEEMDVTISKKNQVVLYHHEGVENILQSRKILKNIIINLLSNAVKYSPDGKEIHITSSVHDGQVKIAIKDNGIGIPDEDKKNMFTEFFRAGNAKNIQGTGLGLCIVKKYAELLDGKISFVSNLGEGTTFTIEL